MLNGQGQVVDDVSQCQERFRTALLNVGKFFLFASLKSPFDILLLFFKGFFKFIHLFNNFLPYSFNIFPFKTFFSSLL